MKRIEEILEAVKELQQANPHDEGIQKWISDNFPELKESEDERIRKALMQNLKERFGTKGNMGEGLDMPDVLAWLEKQGRQKPAEWDILSANKGDMLSNGTIVLIVDSIEKFEGKPIINSWYFADSKKFYGKGTSECDRWEVDGFRTATKAECNYLLKMMADAGYEWDANNLELREIEKKPAEWSEEDEKMCQETIDWFEKKCFPYALESENPARESIKWLKSLKDRVQPKQKWSEEDEMMIKFALTHFRMADATEDSDIIKWLKSLRPQHRWKPSEEQMKALKEATDKQWDIDGDALWHLYQDLKKLIE